MVCTKETHVVVRDAEGRALTDVIEEKTLYSAEELKALDEKAFEKAYSEWREHNLDHDWWEGVYDMAVELGALIGIEIGMDRVKTMGGSTKQVPEINFSGFWSQGDGAKWRGRYRYSNGSTKAIRKECPKDEELHRIADQLLDIQRQHAYRVTAVTSDGHRSNFYSHSGTMRVDVYVGRDEREASAEVDEEVSTLMRDFANWIYQVLEEEHEYLQSEEQFLESCEANEYRFDAEGGME